VPTAASAQIGESLGTSAPAAVGEPCLGAVGVKTSLERTREGSGMTGEGAWLSRGVPVSAASFGDDAVRPQVCQQSSCATPAVISAAVRQVDDFALCRPSIARRFFDEAFKVFPMPVISARLLLVAVPALLHTVHLPSSLLILRRGRDRTVCHRAVNLCPRVACAVS